MLNVLTKKKKKNHKKNHKKSQSNIVEPRQILSVPISSHVICFWFTDFQTLSENSVKTKIGWFEAEKLALTVDFCFLIISKGKVFRADWK